MKSLKKILVVMAMAVVPAMASAQTDDWTYRFDYSACEHSGNLCNDGFDDSNFAAESLNLQDRLAGTSWKYESFNSSTSTVFTFDGGDSFTASHTGGVTQMRIFYSSKNYFCFEKVGSNRRKTPAVTNKIELRNGELYHNNYRLIRVR